MDMVTRLRIAALLVCVASVCACMKPPVRWRYDQGPRSDTVPSMVGLVLPVEDARPARNEGPGLLRYLPLVLWTTERDAMFDLALLENGSRFGSAPRDDMQFTATSSLHEAARLQLAASGAFGPVFGARSEVGAWSPDDRPLRVLKVRVDELQLVRRDYRYGLGPLAFLAHALGAPTGRTTLAGRIDLAIAGDDGSPPATRTLSVGDSRTDGWYRKLEAEQRVLDHLAMEYRKALESLIQDVRNHRQETDTP